jgi:hypothetical protein
MSNTASPQHAQSPYRFGEKEVVVLGLHAQIFEDRVRPESFHVVPVLNLSVSDRVVNAVSWATARSQRFVADKEIQVLRATLGRQVGATSAAAQERGLVRDWGPAPGASSTSSTSLCCNCGRKYK